MVDCNFNYKGKLTHDLLDGEVSVENNSIENLARPCSMGHKAWLFAGGESAGPARRDRHEPGVRKQASAAQIAGQLESGQHIRTRRSQPASLAKISASDAAISTIGAEPGGNTQRGHRGTTISSSTMPWPDFPDAAPGRTPNACLFRGPI